GMLLTVSALNASAASRWRGGTTRLAMLAAFGSFLGILLVFDGHLGDHLGHLDGMVGMMASSSSSWESSRAPKIFELSRYIAKLHCAGAHTTPTKTGGFRRLMP